MALQTLDSLGPLHGYAIGARLEQVSDGALQLNLGTLSPALMRLEQRGLLRGDWGPRRPIAKALFCAVTPAGRRQLARERQAWHRMAGIIHTWLHGEAEGWEIACASFANGFNVSREPCFQRGATATWNRSSGCTWN